MTNQPTHADYTEVSIASLKIKPGTLLQVLNPINKAVISKVTFVAEIIGKAVFVGLPETTFKESGLTIGDQYLVSSFDGQKDFYFTANVTEMQDMPFPHAYLTYPVVVNARVVRKDFRVRTEIIATALKSGENKQVSVTLKDLSIHGTLIESPSSIGGADDRIELTFSVVFDDEKTDLTLPAIIRHAVGPHAGRGYMAGLEFVDMARDVKLLLNYLVFRLASDG